MKKKLLLLILILCIALCGVGSAYYVTRENKSNKDLFMYYITKSEASSEYLEILEKYNKKKEETAYKTKGKIDVKLSGLENDENIQMLNDNKITFEGKVNPIEKMAEQEITAILGMGINVPLNYKQDGDIYALQTNLLTRKYIAIKNEELKELAEKLDIDTEEIPDKINLEKKEFDSTKMKELIEKYKTLIYENLPDEKAFSKKKDGNQMVLSANMTNEEISILLKSILDELKNEELIINNAKNSNVNLNEYYDSINNLMEDLDDLEDENGKAEIKLYIENKKAVGLDILIYEKNEVVSKIIAKMKDENVNLIINLHDEVSLEMNYGIIYNEKDLSMNIDMKMSVDNDKIFDLKGKMEYKNIFTLDNVEENYSFDLIGKMDSIEEIKINYANLVAFDNNIKIEKISEENSYIINDMTEEEIQSLIRAIYQKLSEM